MSTPNQSSTDRSYPLSPTPNTSEVKKPQESFHPPRTPQSPPQPALPSPEKRPVETSAADPMSSTTTRSEVNTAASGSSRMAGSIDTSRISPHLDDPSNKRKREVADAGHRDQKKVHVEDRRLGIEDLHLDVGKKYLLCRTPHPPNVLDMKSDLIGLYGLTPVANKVARVLPNGEKNSLRKTYKGKMKELNVAGKFEAVVSDPTAPTSLRALAEMPDDYYQSTFRSGQEIERGLSQMVLSKLPAALSMARGQIPKTSWDSSVLGELDIPETKTAAVSVPSKLSAPGMQRTSSHLSAIGKPSKADAPRPKRNVKKRGYEESSFEGYGEGYVDDDMAEGGYTSGEGDERGVSQKRRKKNAANQNFSGPARHGSYGPGMVGA